ncbi:DUF1614 domain-containing protein [Coleofasciculus chthonoplastes]|uniref:DUF1614 domain-containing protein n=1 Tax=Coleofasciculus chthonoplastes TaxID=64178 RepID=UPI000312EF85|nr:DUF1614 domain-containing protein [Coleofasciculus chthonoplastes]
MNFKRRIEHWFNQNFDVVQRHQFNWEIRPKSAQGCVSSCLLFGLIFCALFWLTIKFYSIVFSLVMTRLGIAPRLGIPLIITVFFGCFINLPLYLVLQCQGRRYYKFLPVLISLTPGSYIRSYIGLNVSGGLIPIVLALYQFHRTQPLAILIVMTIVALISYFFVTVLPGIGIYLTFSGFWIVTLIAVLASMIFIAAFTEMGLVTSGVARLDVPVAFAGGVLGTTIGGDLLHLKDLHVNRVASVLSIGGAGLEDGIAKCGISALIIAEWLPVVGELFSFN